MCLIQAFCVCFLSLLSHSREAYNLIRIHSHSLSPKQHPQRKQQPIQPLSPSPLHFPSHRITLSSSTQPASYSLQRIENEGAGKRRQQRLFAESSSGLPPNPTIQPDYSYTAMAAAKRGKHIWSGALICRTRWCRWKQVQNESRSPCGCCDQLR